MQKSEVRMKEEKPCESSSGFVEYRFFVLTSTSNFHAPYPLKENGLILFRLDRSRMKPLKSLIASRTSTPLDRSCSDFFILTSYF